MKSGKCYAIFARLQHVHYATLVDVASKKKAKTTKKKKTEVTAGDGKEI